MDRCRKSSIKKRDDSLQVHTWLAANVRGRQLFSNLYNCWQVTPEVRWYQVTVTTKDKDPLGMRSFTDFIWNSLPTAMWSATLSPSTFAEHLKAHVFSWLIAHLRTTYDALHKSTHHHHHHAFDNCCHILFAFSVLLQGIIFSPKCVYISYSINNHIHNWETSQRQLGIVCFWCSSFVLSGVAVDC